MKKIVIAAVVVLALLVTAGGYFAWAHTPAAELAPEETMDIAQESQMQEAEASETSESPGTSAPPETSEPPEPVALLGSLLPGQPWNSMKWVRATPYIGPYASEQYDQEEMYALLESLPLYTADEKHTEIQDSSLRGKDGYRLLVCNPDIQPLTCYTVWIDAGGGVSIESDQASPEQGPQYYRTDPEIVDALDEMLLGYSLRSVTDIGEVKTFGDLLPEQPWSLADWLMTNGQGHAIVNQGQIDPEQLLEIAGKTALVPQDTGMDSEKKYIALIISNPDAVPVQRCDIYVDELGNVEFDLRVAQGYLVVQFYKADPSLYEALVEILCPDEG